LLREPMLAAKMMSIPVGPQWLMEPKYDGWRAITSTIGGIRLETRTGNPITQVPYIADAVNRHIPSDSIIDGEIVDLRSGAKQWNRTQTILSTTRGGYQHKPDEGDPPLTYVIFDVLQVAGEDLRYLPLSERKRRLLCMLPGVVLSEDTVLVHCPFYSAGDAGLDQLIAEGFEGAVVKDVNSSYVCGGRRHGWFKVKPEEEIEATCTGTYPAEPGSKYAPLDKNGNPKPWAVGGLCFRVEHPDGRVYDGRAAGMDDQLRRELHEHSECFIGLVVELAHWGVQDTGALRHPNFRRFRSPAEKARPSRTAAGGVRQRRRRRTSRPAPTPRPSAARPGRMRNYAQMSKGKLLNSIASLTTREGEAYEKCMTIGSGDPARDLEVAERVAREKQFV
jgi:ATP-dependent DNA ligase